jgi:hypothetical protein
MSLPLLLHVRHKHDKLEARSTAGTYMYAHAKQDDVYLCMFIQSITLAENNATGYGATPSSLQVFTKALEYVLAWTLLVFQKYLQNFIKVIICLDLNDKREAFVFFRAAILCICGKATLACHMSQAALLWFKELCWYELRVDARKSSSG